MLARTLAVTLALAAGCGDGQHAMSPAPPDMARGPTDHPPLWRLVKGTGAVQSAPEIWIVVWPGDEAIGAATVDFVDWMLHSDYWTQSLGEYGVGAGVAKGLVVMPTAAPALLADSELQTLTGGLVSSGQITANGNTQVAFLPPTGTTVTAGGSGSCTVFLGYHSHSGGSTAVAYSVTARCEGAAGDPMDQISDTLSHEAAETATDPAPRSGYIDSSPGEQEVGDLCEFGLDLPIDVPPDATHPAARRYWLQRLYSDTRAADGTMDPCQPVAWEHPYWNVALDPPIVTAAPGSLAAIDARLDVYAYGDVGDIKWVASSAGADLEPSSGVAHAGDTIALKVQPLGALRAGDAVEVDLLSESSKAGSQLWIGYVRGGAQ